MEVFSHLKPLPADRGREVTMNVFSLDIENNREFWTDSSGMAMVKRVRDERDWPDFDNDGYKVTSNYYPVTSAIAIRHEGHSYGL